MSTPELTRPISVVYRPDGVIEGYTHLSPESFKIRGLIEVPPQRVIPVIVVPGIMGSNLRRKGRPEQQIWRPPNTPFSKIGAGSGGAVTDAKARQLNFIPEQAEVDPEGYVEVPLGAHHLSAKALREIRGWGGVHWASYGALLSYLEMQLKRVVMDGKLQPEWQQVLQQQEAQRWGARKPQAFDVLSEDELRKLPRAMYPVYAVGYNWLQSNEQSAQALKSRIDEIITQHWPNPWYCKQVLIVTHSMGGLVARRCSQLEGMADKILGIVHGVMPALGAAASYKRVRTGFEGAAAAVLGWNEAEATASMASAPGPLELLPQPGYNGGKPWLHLRSSHRLAGLPALALPKADPYAEIYRQDAKTCWYGLVNSDLIDPAGRFAAVPEGAWGVYLRKLEAAQKFHMRLGNHYHPHTRAYYGAGTSSDETSWGTVCWQTDNALQGKRTPLAQAKCVSANGTGEVTVDIDRLNVSFEMQDKAEAGDGTVPADASGDAPTSSPHVQQCYRLSGFEHQFSYNDPQARLVTLHSIAKLLQRSELVTKPTGTIPRKA